MPYLSWSYLKNNFLSKKIISYKILPLESVNRVKYALRVENTGDSTRITWYLLLEYRRFGWPANRRRRYRRRRYRRGAVSQGTHGRTIKNPLPPHWFDSLNPWLTKWPQCVLAFFMVPLLRLSSETWLQHIYEMTVPAINHYLLMWEWGGLYMFNMIF